jgi:hypothetical protein
MAVLHDGVMCLVPSICYEMCLFCWWCWLWLPGAQGPWTAMLCWQ